MAHTVNYIEFIAKEPLKEEYQKEDLLKDQYLIATDKNIEIYYAPFDYINTKAEVIIVGITPGWTQMEKSFRTLNLEIKKGTAVVDALRKVKSESSFAGTMRKNLVAMLNEIGLNEKLNIVCVSELFERNQSLLHSTSAIRYPVYNNGKNYTGSSPSPIKNKTLWEQIEKYLIPELNQFKGKIIIPLGKKIDEIFENLHREDFVRNNHIMKGFPHPSGGNGHRVRLFNENKDSMKEIIKKWNKQ